jgi:hypothetical protein
MWVLPGWAVGFLLIDVLRDGFALNFGLDYWQPARIADAYAVAAELGSSFKVSRL